MGAHALTYVYDQPSYKPLVCIHVQNDGQPWVYGRTLSTFLENIHLVKNRYGRGFGPEYEIGRFADGTGCLAAQLIITLKQQVGVFYLYPFDGEDHWAEYTYHVFSEEVEVYNRDKEPLFIGPWDRFVNFTRQRELHD